MTFDKDTCIEYICSQGFGNPTKEGLELGRELYEKGSDYSDIGHEVVFHGLTDELQESLNDQ